MGGTLTNLADGRLSLSGVALQANETLEVWLEEKWRMSRVTQAGRNWLIILDDGRVSGGLGLRARRPARVPQSVPALTMETAGGPA